MMRALLLCVLLVFSQLVYAVEAPPPLKTLGTLAVCQYSEFRPVSYGDGQGYEPSLLRAVARQWNVKIVFYPEATFQGLWFLPSKDYTLCDVAIGGITPTPARIKLGAVFSISTIKTAQSLLVRKSDYYLNRVISYDSFKSGKLKIGVIPGSTGEEYAKTLARQAGVPITVFVGYRTENAMLSALKNKQIDAIARSEVWNEYQVSKDDSLMSIAKHDFGEEYAIAVNENNPVLLSRLNSTIDQVTNHESVSITAWLRNNSIFVTKQ